MDRWVPSAKVQMGQRDEGTERDRTLLTYAVVSNEQTMQSKLTPLFSFYSRDALIPNLVLVPFPLPNSPFVSSFCRPFLLSSTFLTLAPLTLLPFSFLPLTSSASFFLSSRPSPHSSLLLLLRVRVALDDIQIRLTSPPNLVSFAFKNQLISVGPPFPSLSHSPFFTTTSTVLQYYSYASPPSTSPGYRDLGLRDRKQYRIQYARTGITLSPSLILFLDLLHRRGCCSLMEGTICVLFCFAVCDSGCVRVARGGFFLVRWLGVESHPL